MSHQQQMQIEEELRRQALIRQSPFNHGQIKFTHEAINAKQAQQLHHKLKGFLLTKSQQARRNSDVFQQMQKYDEIYGKNFQMSVRNQIQDQIICKDIQEMHNMADILLHPPDFDKELTLYKRQMPTYFEREQIDKIFKKYQQAYTQDIKVEQNSAEEAIKRAKRFLLKNFDE